MTNEQKMRFFRHLLQIGFKEIEVSYPAASDSDFAFCRELQDNKEVPDDVWIQVLTPARADLIKRTFEAVAGLKNVIIHMYNATSCIFREVVFNNNRQETIECVEPASRSDCVLNWTHRLAVKHTQLVRELAQQYAKSVRSSARSVTMTDTIQHGTNFRFEYSPETFSQTETEYAVEVCEAVKKTWLEGKESVWADGRSEERIIFVGPFLETDCVSLLMNQNLPATVEVAQPNRFADQVELFCKSISEREKCIISLHTHNDRGRPIAMSDY